MKTTICDICRKPIETAGQHTIKIDDNDVIDLCAECYASPIILLEMRRTRTRKVAKKPARRKSHPVIGIKPEEETPVNHNASEGVTENLRKIKARGEDANAR